VVNGFIDHLYPRLGTTINYNAVAVLHYKSIEHTPSFLSLRSLVVSW
jgi:hypothetical protein